MTDSFDAQRIARLEFQVARLCQHLGLDPDTIALNPTSHGASPAPFGDAPTPAFNAPAGPVLPPGFDAALRDGKLIAAIKIYREATGVGLAEAKKAVDDIVRRGGR
jgi:hypothetical protein